MKCTYLMLFILINFAVFTQEEFKSKTIWYDFKSEVFDGNRKISIFLPGSYFEKSKENFVVCYLFDGQFEPYFNMVSSIMDYYSQSEEAIPMIIVSIHTDNQWEEFTTEQIDTRKITAESLSNHLKKEVIPYIEKNFRTQKFRLGVGHSLGGSYLLYEIFKTNSIFNGVIAASPNMNYGDEILVTQGSQFVKNNPNFQRFVYVNVGNEGQMENSFRQSIEKFDLLVKDSSNWIFNQLEGENHMTTFIKAFDEGLIEFSKQWNISKNKLAELAQFQVNELPKKINLLFENHSNFTQKEMQYDINNLRILAKKLKDIELFDCSVFALDLAIDLCNSDSLNNKINKESLEIERIYNRFYAYNQKAKKAFSENNFKLSSELYLKAFETGAKNGTHIERIEAIQAFTKNKNIEEAFIQLDLLANYFECRSSSNFEKNPYFESLKLDPRWEILMKKMDKNGN